jgi:hypothetical protein
MRDYTLRLTLTNGAGKSVATFDAGAVDSDVWIRGETYKQVNRADVQGVSPGSYRLRLGLIDPKSGTPINLPLKPRTADGTYDVGEIDLR